MTTQTRSLDFRLLDQLEPALVTHPHNAQEAIPTLAFDRLGATTAFCLLNHYRNTNAVSLVDLRHHRQIDTYLNLRSISTFERMPTNNSWTPAKMEMSWIPTLEMCEDHRWTMFRNRLQRAALAAGFTKSTASALAGAFGEMASNAIEHSGDPYSAIAGYAWQDARFEYYVSDTGNGVLASLTSCGQFPEITNHAKALDLAVQPSVSKVGQGVGRGFGFRDVVRSLNQLYSEVRVHSGDHCLDFGGESPSLESRILRETFDWDGFLVSVMCFTSSASKKTASRT